ncbi:hypothetical protein AMATHDRAFT_1327 [Amanita thiersii Skay4041]|uniref:Uncharacterized protein n=1 Tax=Amanita thiersii Skay4041 TaxID=703135 RepID=A0A2A9NV56_9AGAR|nr:hypothetical protein AMATHDRAFT_1327 [Amanita thiersii Skay4041]
MLDNAPLNHPNLTPKRHRNSTLDQSRFSHSQPSSPTLPDTIHHPNPYYTVVGSPADRIISADDPENDKWSESYARSYYWSYASVSATRSSVETGKVDNKGGIASLGKSLTRKVSTKWKKAVNIDAPDERRSEIPTTGRKPPTNVSEPTHFSKHAGSATIEELSRPDFENRRGKQRIKKTSSNRYSMRISVDQTSEPKSQPQTPDTPTSFDHERLSRLSPTKLLKPISSNTSAEVTPERITSGGNKLWKLMKRISAGALRDRYHAHSHSKSTAASLSNYSEESLSHGSSSIHEAPPPVPAIPKDLFHLLGGITPSSPVSSDGHGQHRASDAQLNTSPSPPRRTKDKDRSASSPVPSLPQQRNILTRIRPISSVGMLRRRPSTSTGVSLPSEQSTLPTPASSHTTPSKSTTTSRPGTAQSSSPLSSEAPRLFSTTGRSTSSRSLRSCRSSVSSLGDLSKLPPIPNSSHAIVAQHIVPPGELSEKFDKGQNAAETVIPERMVLIQSPSPQSSLSKAQSVKAAPRGLGPFPTNVRKSRSIGGFHEHWSISRSPEVEPPSLPFPPRSRQRSGRYFEKEHSTDRNELPTRDGLDSWESEERASMGVTRNEEILTSSSTSTPPSLTLAVSYNNPSEANTLTIPGLSTFGRVTGKQVGSEHAEDSKASPELSPFLSSASQSSAGTSPSMSPVLSLRRSSSALNGGFLQTLNPSNSPPPPRPLRSPRRPSIVSKESKESKPTHVVHNKTNDDQENLTPPRPRRLLRKQPPSGGDYQHYNSSTNTDVNLTSSTMMTTTTMTNTTDRTAAATATLNTPTTSSFNSVVSPRRPRTAEPAISTGNRFRAAPIFAHATPSSKAGSPLTEEEKWEKWEHLLLRSEQAGGTLHLTLADTLGDGLLSDKFRLSAAVEDV